MSQTKAQLLDSAYESGAILTGSTNNTIPTVTGANAIAGEANLTFDGTNLGVGITSPDCKLHVYSGDSGGSTASGSTLSIENSTTATLQFLSPNNAYNAIRFGDNNDNGAGWLQYNHSDNSMQFGTNGSEEIRILSSGGIAFNGDTASANALDDYEEATYTPVVSGTDGWTATSSTAEASYVKIGRVCIVSIVYGSSNLSGIGGSAGLRVNLPFTSKASGDNVGQMAISEWSIGSSSISWMGAKVNNNEAFARFQYHNGNNNNTNDLTKDSANNSMNFRGTITYITA